jgi:hypothetical protein
MSNDDKREWVKNHCGSAFVRGISIAGNVAVVVVKGESGIERQVKISLPSEFHRNSIVLDRLDILKLRKL